MRWRFAIIVTAHIIGSAAWFFAVEAVDLSRGGHWRMSREGIQLIGSPLFIFLFTPSWILDASMNWRFLVAGVPAYLVVAVIVYALLEKWRTVATRSQRDLCIRCGYNLTGNVSGVCPECGTVIKKT
jgi:hypothetical protein